MNIAILVSNDFSIIGGAERFIIDIASALNATIVTPGALGSINQIYDMSGVDFHHLNWNLPSEPMKQVIGIRKFKKLSLDYDFFIALDDMSMHYLKTKPNHLYYMLTPRRAFYDMYYDTISTKKYIKSIVYGVGIWYFRHNDRRFVNKHIRNISCISNTVRARIRSTYLRDSNVLYPPIHCDNYKCKEYRDFWLSVNRVDKWKRVDLQVEAFKHMPDKKLVVVGQIYPDMEHTIDSAPENVEFKGVISENEIIELYSTCTGLLTTAINEDFGLTPLEAMASGKPVVATKEGGYLETVIDGHTGILTPPSTISIIKAVNTISKHPEQYHDACIQQASRFDYSIFKTKIRGEVKHIYENYTLEFL